MLDGVFMCSGLGQTQSSNAQLAPRGVRLNIALLGRTNVGKSSVLNMLVDQQISIVSNVSGTTTDAVAKAYELLPLGPVTFFDTAGIDDKTELGQLRVNATKQILYRTDIAIVITDRSKITDIETKLIKELQELNIPFVVVFNKSDKADRDLGVQDWAQLADIRLEYIPTISVSAKNNLGGNRLKSILYDLAPNEFKHEQTLASDLYSAGDVVVCVIPIDSSAPKGRLILPQVQILREALDNNAICITVKVPELAKTLNKLNVAPKLVISDAQVIKQVVDILPRDINLTTFSTLFSRFKGDINAFLYGADTLDILQDGDKILIAEACSHNVQEDDIGRDKLPKLIRNYSKKDIYFDVVSGHDFPSDLEKYRLVLHCGACMFNRVEMMRRVRECQRQNIAITNYGIALSKLQGVLEKTTLNIA